MTLKKTSENGIVVARSDRPPGALLADFDVDGATLKRDHKLWLDEHVITPATSKSPRDGHWQIALTGRASKSGSDAHNMVLAGQRMRSVEDYLGPRLSGTPFSFAESVLGESSPIKLDEYEYELDRSVEILAKFVPTTIPKVTPKTPRLIPKIHIWKPRPNRKVMDFKVQVLKASISIVSLDLKLGPLLVGNGDARVKLLLDIREVGSVDHAMYEYAGKGRGTIAGAEIALIKSKPGLDLSHWTATYDKGSPHPFATDIDRDADEFTSPATFDFDALGRTLRFGPKASWLSLPPHKIRNLSFGRTADEDTLKYAEATTFGELTLVGAVPEWAAT